MQKLIFPLLFLFSFAVSAQETDIIPYLKAIEEGKQDEVIAKLPSLKKQNPEDPSVIFLEGVLTENAEEAVPLFNRILEKYPRSRYADASLYRIYSYYFALGSYSTAEKNLNRLKKEYPESPYIKIAERDIPEMDEPAEISSGEEVIPEIEDKNEKNYRYTIQAGAFSNKKNSSALADEFRTAGFETEVKEKLVAGTLFDVVYVGKFKTEKEAGEFLKRINDRYNLDGRVVDISLGH